jgi:hypothetical protein
MKNLTPILLFPKGKIRNFAFERKGRCTKKSILAGDPFWHFVTYYFLEDEALLHYWPTVMSETELMWGSSCFSKLTFMFRRCKEFWFLWSLVYSVERLGWGLTHRETSIYGSIQKCIKRESKAQCQCHSPLTLCIVSTSSLRWLVYWKSM